MLTDFFTLQNMRRMDEKGFKMIDTNNLTIRFWYPSFRFRPVRMCRHAWQRWTRGFDDSELWCLDWKISNFVLPRLKAFRDVGRVGCPAEFVKGEGTDKDIEAGQREFNLLLDKMIFAFECKVNEELGLPEDLGEYVSGWCLQEGSRSKYKAAQDARQVLIDEGMGLFAKYMHCLWD